MYISESRIINKSGSPYCVTVEMYNAYDIIQESTAEINREFAIINYLMENSTDKKGIINKAKKFIETIIQKIKTIWSVISKAINKVIDQIKIKLNTGGRTKGEFKGNIPQYITYRLYDCITLHMDMPSVLQYGKDDVYNTYTDINKYIRKEETVETYSSEMQSKIGWDSADDFLDRFDIHKVDIRIAKKDLKDNLDLMKKMDAKINKQIESDSKYFKEKMNEWINKKEKQSEDLFDDEDYNHFIDQYKDYYEKISKVADNYKKLIVEILKDINHSAEQFNQIPV